MQWTVSEKLGFPARAMISEHGPVDLGCGERSEGLLPEDHEGVLLNRSVLEWKRMSLLLPRSAREGTEGRKAPSHSPEN